MGEERSTLQTSVGENTIYTVFMTESLVGQGPNLWLASLTISSDLEQRGRQS